MKKYVIIVLSIMLFILVIGTHYSYCAGTINTNILDEGFLEEYDPNKDDGDGDGDDIADKVTDKIVEIVNKVLGILQVIGALLMVVSLGLAGFNLLLSTNDGVNRDLGIDKFVGPGGGPETKFKLLGLGRGYLIGTVLLFAGVTIVRFVFNIFV